MKTSTVNFAKLSLKIVSFFALLLVATLSLSSCSGDDSDADNSSVTPPVSTGTKAPDFTLNSSDGKQVKLSDSNGKVVVLFFFGNGCPSCKAAAPSIESKLAAPYASNSSYQIIGLDQWEGNLASVQSFKSTTGVTFPLLLNAAGVTASYKTTYDRLVVIDKKGNIAFSGSKSASNDVDTVKTLVDQLLK